MSKKVNSELRMIEDQIKEMKDSIETLENAFEMSLNDALMVTPETRERIASMTEEEIEALTEETIDSVIGFQSSVDLEKRAKEYETDVFGYKMLTIKDIKKSLNDIDSFYTEYYEMGKERDALVRNYYEYLKSPEYAEKRTKRIQEMKDRLETEKDPAIKKGIKKTLKMYESIDTLSFLFTRLTEINSDKEISSIIKSFFEPKRGSYVMRRFETKCKKIGIKPQFYSACLGLEDKFLPEEYKPFNNLFLFMLIRFIAYTDVNDDIEKTYATHIVLDVLKLFSHQFNTQDDELAFVEVVKKFDDYFMPYVEEFKEKNVTYCNHPMRIQREKELEEFQDHLQREEAAGLLKEEDTSTNEKTLMPTESISVTEDNQ